MAGRILVRGVGAALAAMASLCAPKAASAQSSAGPMLERVVMVSRHGVRAPTASVDALAKETGRVWPTFSVAPGEMSPHGAKALAAMGAYLHAVYAGKGLLGAGRCPAPASVQVWADGADHRTRQSGQVMADALAPGCGVTAAHGPDGAADPLFDSLQQCPLDPASALQAVKAATNDGTAVVDPAAAGAIAAAKATLGPQACAATPDACLAGPSVLVQGKAGPKIDGPLRLAASLSENVLLEYTDGMAPDEVGWGQGTPGRIAALMPAHDRSFDLLARTPEIAVHRGATLALALVDLLQGHAPSGPNAPPLAAGATVTMIAGHDTNLPNLAGVLGLDWRLPGQPDKTAPDTTLALEVWRDQNGVETVRAVIYSQSLEQLRSAAPLDAASPAGATPLTIGICDGASACPLPRFVTSVRARIPAACHP